MMLEIPILIAMSSCQRCCDSYWQVILQVSGDLQACISNRLSHALRMLELFRDARALLNLKRIQRPFNGLSRAEVFDQIYRSNIWGQNEDGSPYSGTGSHYSVLADPYVNFFNEFLGQVDDPSVVDLGCGDHAIGNRLECASYIGCDISELVLSSNRERFPDVEFKRIDIVEDVLPKGDVGILRQVLQHLDNASIAQFLAKPLPFEYLIITEGLASEQFVPNRDKPTGPNIRLQLDSGIDVMEPPFNFGATIMNTSDVEGVVGQKSNVIRTTIYKL